MPPLLNRPIDFAHRGNRAELPENSLEAFDSALALGCLGIESDCWLSKDGHAVLDHDGKIGARLSRRPISSTTAAHLPDHIPTLKNTLTYLAAQGHRQFHFSIDLKDPAALNDLREQIYALGSPAQTWVCCKDLGEAKRVVSEAPLLKSVHSTSLRKQKHGPERHAADLRQHNIAAINLHYSEWNEGLVSLYHRFGISCFAWDTQIPRTQIKMLDIGVDAIYADSAKMLVETMSRRHQD